MSDTNVNTCNCSNVIVDKYAKHMLEKKNFNSVGKWMHVNLEKNKIIPIGVTLYKT